MEKIDTEFKNPVSHLKPSKTEFDLIQERINYLRENTDFALTLFQNLIGYAIIAADFDGNIIAFNEGAKLIYGYTSEEVIGRQNIELFFPKDFIEAGELQKAIAALIKDERFSYEGEMLRKNGDRFPARVLLTLTKDRNGKVVGFIVIVEDLTERRIAEQAKALRESEDRYRNLVEASPDVIVLMDLDYKILICSHQAAILLGYESVGEVIGRNIFEFIDPKDHQHAIGDMQKVLKTGILRNIEHSFLRKNGTRFPGEISVSLTLDAEGKPKAFIKVLRDITERKRAEEALRHASEQLSIIFQSLPVVGYQSKAESDYGTIYVTPNAKDVTGFAPEDFTSKSSFWIERIHPEDSPKVFEYLPQVFEKRWHEHQYRLQVADGSYKWFYDCMRLIKPSNGSDYLVGMMLDITERKRAEAEKAKMQAQLVQAQKMESMGTLAGGVAHDFNNILTVIQGYAQLGMTFLKEHDPLYQNLKAIHQASIQAANLTRQLLLFSRKQPMEVHSFSLNGTLNNLMKMLNRLIDEDIVIHTALDPELWTVTADPGNVEQVIMNIVINAKDAMPEGGSIKIKTENVEIDKGYCEIYKYARPGRFVYLSIEDTGIGMDKGVMERIFDPFFTTKGLGKGTGLGLSVVYGIVKQHEGWINVSSEQGKGSKFEVYLPASSGTVEEVIKKEVISGQDLQGKGERILLVEDDPGIREFANRVFTNSGYEVLEASNSQEAVDIFEKENGDLSLVFSDVVLPDKSGLQLAEELYLRKPTLKVLLTSGYTDQKSQWSIIREKGYRFIQKPYGLTDLLRVVREVIEK